MGGVSFPAINRARVPEIHTKDTPPSSISRSTTFGYSSRPMMLRSSSYEITAFGPLSANANNSA
jgi:hypothetical protein